MLLAADDILKMLAFQRGILALIPQSALDANVEKAIHDVDALIEEFTTLQSR